MRKERFPSKRKSKLAPRADGPFEIVERVNDNAYKVELPSEYGGVSATFNVGDLSPYLEDDLDLRANPSQPEEDDTFTSPKTLVNMSGQGITSPKTLANSVESKSFIPSPKTLGLWSVESIGGDSAQASSKGRESPSTSAQTIPSPSPTKEAQVHQERSPSVEVNPFGPILIPKGKVHLNPYWIQLQDLQGPISYTLISRLD